MMSNISMKVAGIDTGKEKLDIALVGCQDHAVFANDEAGHALLVDWLCERGVVRIGIEASGGYERKVIARLRAQGFVVIHMQPAQVRAYAHFLGLHAKNDRIDAGLIAACAAARQSVADAPDPRYAALCEHLTLIEQIEEDIVRFKTRKEAVHDHARKERLVQEIDRLKAWRLAELRSLTAAIKAFPDMAQRLALIESVQGIGPRTALALALRAPELGSISRQAAAALAGLAPYDNDSGTRSGTRRIAGGRKRLRKSLYAAALPAAFQHNPKLIDLYQRLVAKGKPHKLALVACARKLIIYVNSVLERGTPWVKIQT